MKDAVRLRIAAVAAVDCICPRIHRAAEEAAGKIWVAAEMNGAAGAAAEKADAVSSVTAATMKNAAVKAARNAKKAVTTILRSWKAATDVTVAMSEIRMVYLWVA